MPQVFIKTLTETMAKNKLQEDIAANFRQLNRKLYPNMHEASNAIKSAYNHCVSNYQGRAVPPELKQYHPDQHSKVFHIDNCYMQLIEVNEED